MNTAVALIIFKRPDCTRKVFTSICEARPPRLYIVSDGPRAGIPGESEIVEETRKVVESVDWPCDVIRIYRDSNWGCNDNISNALDYIFEKEDALIILEDDCLPHPCFYGYCELLLEKYAGEPAVMSISGDRSFPGAGREKSSFSFSKYPLIWGWATWRRAWAMNGYSRLFQRNPATGRSELKPPDSANREFYRNHTEGKTFTWDYVWRLTLLANKGLSCIPSENLVTNIGYGENATHTRLMDRRANYPSKTLAFPLVFPRKIKENKKTNYLIERHVHHRLFLKDRIKIKFKRYHSGIKRRLGYWLE